MASESRWFRGLSAAGICLVLALLAAARVGAVVARAEEPTGTAAAPGPEELAAQRAEMQTAATELREQIAAEEKALKKLAADAPERREREMRLLGLRELARAEELGVALSDKLIGTLQAGEEAEGPAPSPTAPELPRDEAEADRFRVRMNLLESRVELLEAKLESLEAERESKQAEATRRRHDLEAGGLPDLERRLAEKSLRNLELEQRIIARELELEQRNLAARKAELEAYREVLARLPDHLRAPSEAAVARKARRALRKRALAGSEHERLAEERKEVTARQERLERRIADLEQTLVRAAEEDRPLLEAKRETLELEKQLLAMRIKRLNWRETAARLRTELDKAATEAAELLAAAMSGEIDSRKDWETLRRKAEDYLEELRKGAEFHRAKAGVYAQQIEAIFLELDAKEQELELARQQGAPGPILRELEEQARLIEERGAAAEEARAALEQIRMLYELNRTPWQELFTAASSRRWGVLRLLGFDIGTLQLVLFACVLLITFVVDWLARKSIRSAARKEDWRAHLHHLRRPIRLLIVVVGVHLALKLLPIPPPANGYVNDIFEAAIIVCVAYLGVRAADFGIELIAPLVQTTETKLDDQLLPVIRKTIKVIVVSLGSVMLIEKLGYPVTSLLAGLGIGGLAFALAAKDTIANLFGGVTIFTDKPFQIGDAVTISGNTGVIEMVGLRSTKIRTFADTLITIPNQTVANATIENLSALRKRRVKLNVGLTYDSGVQGLRKGLEIIRNVMENHPGVLEGPYVFFDNFGASSLDIMVYYFTATTVYREYLEIKEEINLQIMEQLAAAGLSFAFPTTTVELANPEALRFLTDQNP